MPYRNKEEERVKRKARWALVRDKYNAMRKERYHAVKHLPETKLAYRNNAFKTKYGITVDDYNDMLDAQDGKCRICLKPPPGKRPLSVDHDHETGEVRGLLCQTCNTFIGRIDEDPEGARRAIVYLLGIDEVNRHALSVLAAQISQLKAGLERVQYR